MEFHDAANIFPLDEEHLDDLAKDIKANGQIEPVRLLDGKILDGRRRWMACEKAGVKAKTQAVQTDDPVGYVISLNLHRRHLTPAQLGMCAGRANQLREKLKEEAKRRMSDGGKTAGRGRPQGKEQVPYPIQDAGQTRDAVGKEFGVSGRSVDYAIKIINEAEPEIVKAVEEGRMALTTAAILSSEPKEVQRAEAADPKRRRDYKSVSNPPSAPEEGEPDTEFKKRGVGIDRAHDAINCLKRIPKNDALRKRGFQIVMDYIKFNQ